MTKSSKLAFKSIYATFIVAAGLWIGMSFPAFAATPSSVTITVDREVSQAAPVFLEATVTPPTATGTVQFSVDGVDVGSPVPVSTGTARSAPITDLEPGLRTVAAEYSGDATYEPSSATGQYQHEERVNALLTFTYDQTPGPHLVPIVATVTPSDATGTVTFRLDDVDVGTDVPLVNGTAQSIPVDIPDGKSYSILVSYSGDAFYSGSAAAVHSDVEESAPEPSPTVAAASTAPAPVPEVSPAATKVKVLARTGSETMPLAGLAAFLFVAGFAMLRAGQLGVDRP
jgi:hypothetical protein